MRFPRFPNRESVFAEPKARHFFRPGRGIIGRPDETFCEEYARRLAEMSLARILVLRSLSFSPSNPLLHGRNVLFCTLHRSCASWIPRKRDRDDLRRPLRENDARSATLPPATLTIRRCSAPHRSPMRGMTNRELGIPESAILAREFVRAAEIARSREILRRDLTSRDTLTTSEPRGDACLVLLSPAECRFGRSRKSTAQKKNREPRVRATFASGLRKRT